MELAELGNRASAEFLEQELRELKSDKCRASIEWEVKNGIAFSDNEIPVTFALVSLRIRCGFLNMKELLGTKNPYKLEWIRRLCWKSFGVSPMPLDDWATRAMQWIDEQLSLSCNNEDKD